jgi:hypothetical protein
VDAYLREELIGQREQVGRRFRGFRHPIRELVSTLLHS